MSRGTKSNKSLSVEEYKVVGRFDALRTTLLSPEYAAHLDKPLAYWALPSDRRLPLAFLGRTLRSLLDTPFAELSATPGIGDKKMRSFIELLSRATRTDPSELARDGNAAGSNGRARPGEGAVPWADGFDPGTVSEVVWSAWRASPLRLGLGGEKLGRFAPSLRNVTRVVWNQPLEFYARHSLAEIRQLKTHGEKRVRAILEVFHAIHSLVDAVGTCDHLVVRIVPRRIDAVEQWMARTLLAPGVPDAAHVRCRLVEPLLAQIRVDAAEPIAQLAERRLGLAGSVPSVRQMAREMELTRARVYQLLNEINDIMNVRWPTGRRQVHDLRTRLQEEMEPQESSPALELVTAAIEVFYPGGRRGAAGPLEPLAGTVAEPIDRPGHPEPAEAVSP